MTMVVSLPNSKEFDIIMLQNRAKTKQITPEKLKYKSSLKQKCKQYGSSHKAWLCPAYGKTYWEYGKLSYI